MKNKLLVIPALLLSATSVCAGSHNIRLHITADSGAEQFVQNICITTNNGFTKSCGNEAKINRSSGNQNLLIVSYDLYGPLGFDNSCAPFRISNQPYKTPKEKGTLHIYTVMHKDIVNHVRVLSVTQCTSSFSPYNP